MHGTTGPLQTPSPCGAQALPVLPEIIRLLASLQAVGEECLAFPFVPHLSQTHPLLPALFSSQDMKTEACRLSLCLCHR